MLFDKITKICICKRLKMKILIVQLNIYELSKIKSNLHFPIKI